MIHFRVTDTDFWFCSKELQLKMFEKQIRELMNQTQQMIKIRKQILQSTNEFIEIISSIAVTHPKKIPNNKELLIQTSLLAEAYNLQIQADTKVFNLAKDYARMMGAVKNAQNDRKAVLMQTTKLQKKEEIIRDDSEEVNE